MTSRPSGNASPVASSTGAARNTSGLQLWLPFALLILSLIALLSYTVVLDRQDDLRNAETASLNNARILQVRLEATLNRIDAILLSVARQIPAAALSGAATTENHPEITALLKDQLHGFSEVSGLWIVDAAGKLRYGDAMQGKQSLVLTDRSYFQEHLQHPHPHLYISGVIDGKIVQRQVIVFSRGMYDANSRFLGIVMISIALENLQQQFREINVGQRGSIAVRRSDNLEMVVRWPHIPALVNTPLPATDPIAIQILAGNQVFNSRHNAQADGEQRVFGVVSLRNFPFYVAVALHEEEILASWRKRSLLLCIVVLLVAAVAVILSRGIGQSKRRERQALIHLRRHQQRTQLLASAFESCGEAILLVNSDGLIEEINQSCIHLTGLDEEDWLQQPWQQFFSPEKQEAFPAISEMEQVWRTECLCKRHHHDSFPVLLTVARVMVEHLNTTYLVVNFIDISERRRAEQLKSDFVSVVSHELRTPLTSICGSLALVNRNTVGQVPDEFREVLLIAEKNSLRLKELINDLLDIEKLESGKMRLHLQPLSATQVVRLALESISSYAAAHQIRCEVRGDAQDVYVVADPVRIQQVLANLLSNAVKFSAPGSSVELEIQPSEREVRFTVIDHGTGIAQSFRNKVFLKFAQAEHPSTRRYGGTGLGLSITKELVERMGGSIGFYDTPGQGASFWFSLERIHENTSATSAEHPALFP
ncbi:ATP-binding protein [Undibacterium squillarum]|uniref:ATP-binding protein n=1 Tax=Undibacterium squillarum TaxID=1131567 RepID=UPI0035B3A954